MVSVRVSEATGASLDYMVAKCEGKVTELGFDGIVWGFKLDGKLKVLAKGWAHSMMWNPSTDWAQGGPIIEREGISLSYQGDAHGFTASMWSYKDEDWYGFTEDLSPLIAAMRCYVASKLGDEVEVPEELV